MSANLDRIGVTAERIPAVEASSLAARDEYEISHGNGPLYRINYGSAAGMMGHQTAMKRLLLSPAAPAALILEDDAELAEDTAKLLRSVDWWPDDALAVRLEEGGHRHRLRRLLRAPSGKTPSGRDLCRMERWIPGSAAYLIDRRGAEIMLDAFADPWHSVDHSLFDMRVSEAARRLRTVQIVPAMARQRPELPSDQVQWRAVKKATAPLSERLYRLYRRVVWSVPYKARLGLLMLFGFVREVDVDYREELSD